MAAQLTDIIQQGLLSARDAGKISFDTLPPIVLEASKQAAHGDVACPVALGLAKQAKKKPRDIAQACVDHMELPAELVAKVEIAGPGFINFHLAPGYWTAMLPDILDKGDTFGRHDWAKDQKVLAEFVSANPTGPLHVGHGRGAVVGDAIARLLAACGAHVDREYYVNDVGNQMNILGRSTYVRYAQAHGKKMTLPDDHYQGEYITEIAEIIRKADGKTWLDKDEADWLPHFCATASAHILEQIRTELNRFDIHFDRWYSEKELYQGSPNRVEAAMDKLTDAGLAYKKDGARWLATTEKGDDKDRVLVKKDGATTYFASDVAYHQEKFERGYTRLIDVWGADHHGYVGRMKAATTMLGKDPDALTIVLVQLVSLLKGGEPVAMSTRAGQFVTLSEVVDEIGTDATRFYFLTRKSDAHLEFDLEVAKSQTADNPVYYVQYAHARVHQLQIKAKEAKLNLFHGADEARAVDLTPLATAETVSLIKKLAEYPQVVDQAGRELAVHRIPYYLQELAGLFHAYYYNHRFVSSSDVPTSHARMVLAAAVGQVIKNGLTLMGVSAPTRM